MRAAQFALEGAGGPAELVVYYFGSGGAGGAQANLQRWYGQFEQPDQRASADVAKTENFVVAEMKITLIDLEGTYVAAVRPGAAERNNQPNYRMLAAIVESPTGPYYFKMVGPSKTVAEHRDGFVAALKGIRKSS